MARIPDDEIQRLKSEVSVERLVTSFGEELRATNFLVFPRGLAQRIDSMNLPSRTTPA